LDVATNNTTNLGLQRDRDSTLYSSVRIIWSSPTLPEDPMVWRKDLDPKIKAKLLKFFMNYGRGTSPQAAQERAKIARMSIGGFKAADNTHLLPVREMEATEAFLLAKDDGDAVKIAAAQKALTLIQAERKALAGRKPK
jgi:phosphonate transport system substrate-binding protein